MEAKNEVDDLFNGNAIEVSWWMSWFWYYLEKHGRA